MNDVSQTLIESVQTHLRNKKKSGIEKQPEIINSYMYNVEEFIKLQPVTFS